MWDFEMKTSKPASTSWKRQIGPALVWGAFLLGLVIAFALIVMLLVQSISRYNDAMRFDGQENFSGFRSAHTYQAGR